MKSILAVATSALCLFASTATASHSSNVRIATQNQIKEIQHQVDNLTTSIKNWDHSFQYALSNIYNPAIAVSNFLGNATADLKKDPIIFSIDQAFRIAGAVQDLAYSVNISVAALNSQVKPFTAMLINPIVINALEPLYNSTKIYSDELSTYVQEKLRPIAYVLQDQALDSVQQGLDCFNNPNNTVACNSAAINPNKTHQEALHWGAIRPDGGPIA